MLKTYIIIFFLLINISLFSAGLHITVEKGITAIILTAGVPPISLEVTKDYFEISTPQGGHFTKEIHICSKEGETYNYDAGTEGFDLVEWEYNGNIYKAQLNIPGINGWRDLHIDVGAVAHVGPWLLEPSESIKGTYVGKGPLLKECPQ